VWPGPPFFRCERDKAGLFDPTAPAHAKLPAELERPPTDQLPIVRFDAKAGERSLDLARWGLVPYWAKDIKVGFANINAKAEGIETVDDFSRQTGAAQTPKPPPLSTLFRLLRGW
jgi:putative SOS response-associated peptidase YedK